MIDRIKHYVLVLLLAVPTYAACTDSKTLNAKQMFSDPAAARGAAHAVAHATSASWLIFHLAYPIPCQGSQGPEPRRRSLEHRPVMKIATGEVGEPSASWKVVDLPRIEPGTP
jgi:hypothetical protein